MTRCLASIGNLLAGPFYAIVGVRAPFHSQPRTTAKAFSSEEYFTLYWKEIGIRVACAFGPDLL
jgi:hypothetical protein